MTRNDPRATRGGTTTPRVAQPEERLPSKQEAARSNRGRGHHVHRFSSQSGDGAGLKSRRAPLETEGKYQQSGRSSASRTLASEARGPWCKSRRPCHAGLAQREEHSPDKREARGSSPWAGTRHCPVAQSGERRAVNATVAGSIPAWTASLDGGRSSRAEPRAVNPAGVGAIPTDHPSAESHIRVVGRVRASKRIRRERVVSGRGS